MPPVTTEERRLPPTFESYATESLPQSPAGAVGKGGTLELRLARGDDGRSRLVFDRATVPFHLTRGLYHDEELPELVSVYVQDPTGGIAQGDRYDASIRVEADAQAHISTGSATKVLSMERNYGSSSLELTVDDGAFCEYLPEPTILHEDARYVQSIAVDVGTDAVVFLSDTVVPGRLARGEAFAFERLHTGITAHRDGDPLFTDTVSLDGGDHLRGPGLFGEFRVVGTFYVVAPDHDVASLADDLHACVQEQADDRGVGGASVLPRDAGVAVRVLGMRASDVTDRFERVWDRARRELVGVGASDTRKF